MADLSCIIIEDEPLAMDRTRSYVEKIEYLDLNGTFDNALDGLGYLKRHRVDLLFLDINMDELSGVELLESANISANVIITTAYPQYALKGFELSVADYLLKPFTFQRFLQAVEKVYVQSQADRNAIEYVFVKSENRLEKILLVDILFIEGMRDYRRIHTRSKRIMTLQTFTELEKMLPARQVCRVHKSYMVAIDKVEAIERGQILIGQERIPVSAKYRDGFFRAIGM